MRRKNFSPPTSTGRRPGWGRPIFVEFPVEMDARIEAERARLGLDRASFVRSLVMERLSSEAA